MITTLRNNEKEIIKESIFVIGKVFSVEGRIVKVKVNKNKNLSHLLYDGKIVKNVSVGGYIKIVKGFVNIIGKVEGEYITEEKYFNKDYNKEEIKIDRILQVSLFGHFDKDNFKQGIKEMPLIDNECYLLDLDEFNSLHQFYKDGSKVITVGNLSDEPSQKIKLCVNKLFASHIGIFGNTGSGKSNTLAKIYTELFVLYKNKVKFKSRSIFLLIDFNGEYAEKNIITEEKYIYKLSTRNLQNEGDKYKISKKSFNKIEIISILCEATEKTQTPFLSRSISNVYLDDSSNFNKKVINSIKSNCKNAFLTKQEKNPNVNIFSEMFQDLHYSVELDDEGVNPINSIMKSIDDNLRYNSTTKDFYWGSGANKIYDNSTSIYDTKLKSKIDSLKFKSDYFSILKLKIILNFYRETLKGYSNHEHIRPLIGRMLKKFRMVEKIVEIVDDSELNNSDNNFNIVSLKDVNLEMKKIIPLIICKQLYDAKKESPDRETSLHLIIDEAHNILSSVSQRESETWKDYRLETFEEIIKEGRKFGTFLTIASQRPSDISTTIISQLHNYFIHRLINNNDILAIEKTVAYLDKLSFQSIPILSVGNCIIAGLASDIPVRVDIDLLTEKKRPKSETIDLEDAWKNK
jgi:DNA helicase HerA-like ATPase